MANRPRIGITLGDPAGIGPEVVLKALRSGQLDRRFDYEIIGNPRTKRRADAIDWVVEGATGCLAGELAAIATAPITKELLHRAGYPFTGQTELLAHLSHTRRFAMMLAGGPLRVALVTTHVPLRDVAKLIAARRGIAVSGPYSADTLFYRAAHGEFDAVVAMYHDQGLAPFKLIAFDNGVNLTLGLPFIRTSPDHGTAPDIAGKGVARPEGMIAAINMAAQLATTK